MPITQRSAHSKKFTNHHYYLSNHGENLTMFSNEIDYLVRREQMLDHLRRLENHHLISEARQGHADQSAQVRQVIARVGTQLVKWGEALQQVEPTARHTKTA